MTHSERSQESLRQVEPLCRSHPYTIVWGLSVAVVFALLAIAVAIEALNREY